jgi:hypothetical protein
MGIIEKIKDIEAEIARTQKNKATEHHLGMLKAKLAKYLIYYHEFVYFYIFDTTNIQISTSRTYW